MRIWTPTCFLWPTRVRNPNGILIGSAVCAQLTAECRRACPGMFSPKIAHSNGGIWTPSNTWFLRSTRVSIPNGITIGSAVFAQLAAECPYILQRTAPSPQNCRFPRGIMTPYNTWFLEPTQSSAQTASRSVEPFFAGLTAVTDRQTDRKTTLLGR